MSTKKEPQLNFSEVWERIKKETAIKNQTQLGELIGITQQSISQKKRENEFPIWWAYIIAKEYHLSMDWLFTGEKPIRIETAREPKNSYGLLIDEWLDEIKREDPGREEWFRCNFEDAFPSFKSWAERKKIANQHRRLAETVA